MTDPLHKAKLANLVEIEGYDRLDQLMEAVFSDAVSPAICMNEGCDLLARWSLTRTPAIATNATRTR